MAFLIESDPAFPAATVRSPRSAANAADSKSGEAFARSLQQDKRTAESEGNPEASSGSNNTNETYARSIHETGAEDKTENADATAAPFSGLPSEQDIKVSTHEAGTDAASEIEPDASRSAAADGGDADSKADPFSGDSDIRRTEDGIILQAAIDASPSPAEPGMTSGNEEPDLAVQAETHPPVNTAIESEVQTPGAHKDGAPSTSDVQAMLVQATSASQAGQQSSKSAEADLSVKATSGKKAAAPGMNGIPPSAAPQDATDLTDATADSPDDAYDTRLSTVDLSVAPTEGELQTGDPGKSAHSLDGSPQVPSPTFGAVLTSQAPTQTAQTQVQMAPTHALVTASPAETVKIITDAIASPDDTPDRITVQLDPPELGRVSIDFKFDANGLQHITVTGDSPEALKQLRLMHFELTQALERNGLSSQNMTFQQQQSGQQQSHASPSGRMFENAGAGADAPPLTTANLTADSIRPARTASGGLDIRL